MASKQEHPSLCYVPKFVHHLQTKLSEHKENEAPEVTKLKKNLLTAANARFQWILNRDNIALRAAVLHPDRSLSNFVDANIIEKVWQGLKAEKLSLENVSSDDFARTNMVEFEMDFIRSELNKVQFQKDSEQVGEQPEETDNANEDSEELPGMIDPLVFYRKWKETHRIEKLIKKYLCIPASSTPSERAFSDAGIVYNEQRAMLNPETAEKLIFISENQHLIPADICQKIEKILSKK